MPIIWTLGKNMKRILMMIKKIPMTTRQKINTAKKKRNLNRPSICFYLSALLKLRVDEKPVAVTQINIINLTKIILYFFLFDKLQAP